MTVVRADDSPTDVTRRLASALAGDAVDLRPSAPTPAAVITAAALRQEAVRRAAVAHGRRSAARDEAVAHRTDLASLRTQLLERAAWCEASAGPARALAASIADAEAAAAAATAEAAAASARRERVAEQRAAADAALREARLELESLEGAALDETGVRRELESATRAEREAADALQAADAEVARLRARVDELDAERAQLVAARDELAARAEIEPEAAAAEAEVREALAVYDELADRAGPDIGALRLAEDFERVEAEIANLRQLLPEPPTEGQIEGAVAEAAAARRRLDGIRAAAASVVGPTPDWWTELNDLHVQVVEAEAAFSGAGLRKANARRRYEEAVAAERARLDELGFGSHLDALMSGGKRVEDRAADDARVAEATDQLAEAARAVEQLRADARAGAPLLERLAERDHLLGAAAGMLGCDPGDRVLELLAEHPAVPPLAMSDLSAAVRLTGIPTAGIGVATAARRWLAAIDATRDPDGLAGLERRLADVVAQRHDVENALAPSEAVAERAAAAAAAAARTVTSLESELRSRAGEDAKLLERTAAATALREQVDAVEAGLAKADAEALEAWAAAAEALHAAQAEHDRVTNELADLTRRASRAAADLPAERRPAFDLVSGLVPLGAVLRDEAVALGAALAAAEQAVAEAEAACGPGADTPTAADVADGVLSLIAAAPTGVPLLFAEPFAGVTDIELDVEPLLEAVREATVDRPTIVVTADLAVVGWAIGLPADQGTLVPARSLDALLGHEAGVAATTTPSSDTAVPARPSGD